MTNYIIVLGFHILLIFSILNQIIIVKQFVLILNIYLKNHLFNTIF